jgi:hypothetical protein
MRKWKAFVNNTRVAALQSTAVTLPFFWQRNSIAAAMGNVTVVFKLL